MIEPGIRKGRAIHEGFDRGFGMQFGDLCVQLDRDPDFQAALTCANDRTVVTPNRLRNLFLILTRYAPKLPPGHIVEFGSYRCGSAFFMARIAQKFLPGTTVYALDTFSGMPPTDPRIDGHRAGEFASDFDEAMAAANTLGLDNVRLVKGLFAETAPAILSEAKQVRLAHIDCDIYDAVRYAYDIVKLAMVPGGYFVFDDSTTPSCLGATEAVEELVVRRDGLLSEQIWPHHVFRAPGL